jgi:hypothetical protein
VKVIVEVQDLQPGRASSYTVATYVRAVLKLEALRRDLAHAMLEIERWRNAIKSRRRADILLAEAQALLTELEPQADGYDDQRRS